MTFNVFTAKRVSCFGQYDRIDDLVLCNLRGDKCPVFGQFLVDEFHFSAVLNLQHYSSVFFNEAYPRSLSACFCG